MTEEAVLLLAFWARQVAEKQSKRRREEQKGEAFEQSEGPGTHKEEEEGE